MRYIKKYINEDMLSPADSPAYSPSPIHQVPGNSGVANDMDAFSKLGPGKPKTKVTNRSKRNKKKEETIFPSNKVMTFQVFVKNNSTES